MRTKSSAAVAQLASAQTTIASAKRWGTEVIMRLNQSFMASTALLGAWLLVPAVATAQVSAFF
jgi:hypothetical protein